MAAKYSYVDIKNMIEQGYSKSKICLNVFGNNAGKTYKRLDKLLLQMGICPSDIAPARGSNSHTKLFNECDLALLSLKPFPMSNRQYRKFCLIFNREICHNCFVKRTLSDYFLVEVHHIDGDRHNNHIENLIPLCANCHKEEHLHLRMNQDHLYTVLDYVERVKECIKQSQPYFKNRVLNFTKPNELLYLIKTAKMINYIDFTEEKVEKLEKAYKKAEKEKVIQFNFENKKLFTDYAKTLIKHIKKVNK